MPTFKIRHLTKYIYDRKVKESVNEIKVYPHRNKDQEVLHHELVITGDPFVDTYTDYWGNRTGVFNLLPLHDELTIDNNLVVRTAAATTDHLHSGSGFEQLKREINGHLQMIELTAIDHIAAQASVEQITDSIYHPEKSVAATIQDCCTYIFEHFNYIKGITDVESTVDEILEHGAGVCQDFTHLMLQILRTLHIPSRYVSGYICPNKNGMRGEGATHAWTEAWIPGYGWAGIDPTNNVWVTDNHVKLAVGRHFHDCSPVKGTFKGPAVQKLSVHVSVSYEDGNYYQDSTSVKTQTLNWQQEPIKQKIAAISSQQQ